MEQNTLKWWREVRASIHRQGGKLVRRKPVEREDAVWAGRGWVSRTYYWVEFGGHKYYGALCIGSWDWGFWVDREPPPTLQYGVAVVSNGTRRDDGKSISLLDLVLG